MRTNPASRSGVLNPRLCLALLLCSIGVLLGVASSAVPTPPCGTLPGNEMVVTISEFSDFQCPYCKRAASVVEQVRQTYGQRVKVIFKHMPLRMHEYAFKAAQASVCAQQQGKFWEYHNRLFAASDLSTEALNRIAAEVGLKETAFNQCMASDVSRAVVEKDIAEANRLGVRGTPIFVVNGTPLRGAISFVALKQEIDHAMLGAPHTVARTVGQSNIWQALPQSGLSNTLALIQQVALTETANQQQAATTTADGVTLSPVSINFGYQLVGTTTGFLFTETVTNSGTGPLTITDISVSGHDHRNFTPTYSFSLPVTVSPGSSIFINLTFTPSLPWTPGTRNARLEISEGANSQYVPLTGIGATCLGPVPACSSGCPDTDGDGLNDAWEIAGGVDLDNDGTIDENDLLLPGADPNTPDVYLHYDYTVASDHSHNPPSQAIQWIVDAFAAHGINLHIDPQHNAICENAGDPGCITAGTGAHVASLTANPDPSCVGTSAVSPAQMRAAVPYLNRIKWAYHYMIFGHYVGCPGDNPALCANCPTDPESPACGNLLASKPSGEQFGMAEVFGDDSIVATQPFVDVGIPSVPLESWAGLAMHEFGHNLGLLHGGSTDAGAAACNNFKPNYVSVMSYLFYGRGIRVAASPGGTVPQPCTTDADCNAGDHAVPAHCSTTFHTCFRIDYSDRVFNTLDETGAFGGLNETLGLQGGANNTDISFWFHGGTPAYVPIPTNGSPIDWNKDGNFTDTGVITEINDGDGAEVEIPQNDWATRSINGVNQFINLNFGYQCSSNFGD